MKLDVMVQNDFQWIYDGPMVRFEPKSNPMVRNKSQWFFFYNPMAILTLNFFINTPKIIQFHYKLIHPHLSSIGLSNYFFFVLYPNTRLIKVCFFVNLFCVYVYFIFNV